MMIPKFIGRKKWGLLGCSLLVAFMVACAAKTPKERLAVLVVSPSEAKAGAVLVIKGYQFLPDEEIEVIMTVGDVYHALGTEKAETIIAKKDGTFEVSSGVPVKTPPGTYKVEAFGNKGSVGFCNVTVLR